MKYFAITKVGYTSGVYGNSGEQFVAIWTGKDGLKSYAFEGQYGVESRVAGVFKKEGYEESYIGNRFGRMTRQDAKHFSSEYTAMKVLPILLRLKHKSNSNGTHEDCGTKNMEYGIKNGSYWFYCLYCGEPVDKSKIS